MHASHFIQDIAVVMLIAGFTTVIFRRIRQPVVLGYILAGFIISPYTPPFSLILDEEIIKALASLGVILLMFSLGLHFNLQKLKKVGVPAFVAAIFEILFMIWIGYEMGHAFGWNDINSIFLGSMLAISSTTIIVKALEELGLIHEKFSELVFGILIVEDILAIALIAFLSSLAQTGSFQFKDVISMLSHLGIFLTILLVLGLLIVPSLLRWIDSLKSKETLLVSVLGLCFGVSILAIKLGYSEALGAFMMGAIIAEARGITDIDHLVAPVRDMFSAIFFVSVGMMIDPRYIQQHWILVLVISFVVIVGKIATSTFGSLISGCDLKTSVRVGMSLGQIGEFSFIIASLGVSLKVLDESMYPIAVMVSVLTTLATPYLIRYSDKLTQTLEKKSSSKILVFWDLYASWIQKLFHEKEQSLSRKELRTALMQLFVNLIFVTAILTAANASVEYIEQSWPDRPRWIEDLNPLCWGVGMLISLPLITMSFVRLRKLGIHFADRLFSLKTVSEDKLDVVKSLFANTFLASGIILVGLWILILSAAMFTNISSLMALGILVIILGIVFSRLWAKLYSKAHGFLLDNLSK